MIYNNMSVSQEQTRAARPTTTKPARQKARSPPSEPFDANELSRRLYLVLADQKAQSEKRRRARADAAIRNELGGQVDSNVRKSQTAAKTSSGRESSSKPTKVKTYPGTSTKEARTDSNLSDLRSSKSVKKDHPPQQPPKLNTDVVTSKSKEASPTYHHVPKEAASQFARTTTAVNVREGGSLIHKMSRNALKFHLQGDRSAVADSMSPSDQSKALRKAQERRGRELERNQFQRTAILEEAAELDEARQQQHNNRHTFAGEFGGRRKSPEPRRNSTSDVLDKEERHHDFCAIDDLEELEESDVLNPMIPNEHFRVDWTQSDEMRRKGLMSPLLKRADSIWTLRGRLGSKGREDKEATVQEREHVVPTEALKSPKSGFFSRFKR